MSFHLFDLDEPVESALVDDFFESADSLGLRQEDSEWRLEIGRKSREYIGLNTDGLERVDRSVHSEDIISQILISNSYLQTLG